MFLVCNMGVISYKCGTQNESCLWKLLSLNICLKLRFLESCTSLTHLNDTFSCATNLCVNVSEWALFWAFSDWYFIEPSIWFYLSDYGQPLMSSPVEESTLWMHPKSFSLFLHISGLVELHRQLVTNNYLKCSSVSAFWWWFLNACYCLCW